MFIIFVLICLLESLLLLRVILSWVQKERYNRATIFICDIFEPVLKPVRKILPSNKVGIDFSPIVIFIILEVIKQSFFRSFF